jgi:GNAT superfamily N-acetyltransferase
MDSFLSLTKKIYRNDDNYCFPAPESVLASLLRPDYQGHQIILLADENGRSQVRIVARISNALKDSGGKPFGMLGFFEAINNQDAVNLLFDNAVSWLKENGAGRIIGPMNGDTWHKYRINAGPFDKPPFLMEPYNKDYYEKLWLDYGFQKLEEYYSSFVEDVAAAKKNTDRFTKRVLSRGYKLRPINMSMFEKELAVIYKISTEIFAGNFLYTHISLDEFLSLYNGVESILDKDFIWFMQSRQEEDIGFVFAFPDRMHAVRSMKGKRNLAAKLRFFCLKNRTDTINIKSLGIVPAYQRTGAAVALMNCIYGKTLEKGYTRNNLCLIRKGNPSGRMDGGQGKILRRYHLYELNKDAQ